MSYSNKIFNVNGYGINDLLSTIKLATSDTKICGYLIRNDIGLKIYFSQSMIPDDAIMYETPKSIEEEIYIIENYLEKIKEIIPYNDLDILNESLYSENNSIRLGWRVFTELSKVDKRSWWDHSIIVRPSYVII